MARNLLLDDGPDTELDSDLDALEAPAETGAGFVPHPGYKHLDDGVRETISAKEFAWLPDSERLRFMSSIGEAEAFPDS